MRKRTLIVVVVFCAAWSLAAAQDTSQPPAQPPAAEPAEAPAPAGDAAQPAAPAEPAAPAVPDATTPAPAAEKVLRVQIDILRGEAQVRFPGEDWKDAAVGMVLPEQSVLFTGIDTTCVLNLEGLGVVQVLSFTELNIDRFLLKSDKVTSDIALRTGEIEVNVEGGVYTAALQVHTPNATASVRGTRWQMSVGGGRTACHGQAGMVSFSDRHGRSQSVGAGDKSAKQAGQAAVTAPSEERKNEATTNIAPQGTTSTEKTAATKIASATTGVLASDKNDARSDIAQQRTESRAQEDAAQSERSRKRRDIPPPIMTK